MNLGVRAVHRAIDTGGACGGAGHAGSAGCPLPETTERGILRAGEVAFCLGRQVAGAGESARSRTVACGGIRLASNLGRSGIGKNCRSLGTENSAGAGFLIGSNRPIVVLPEKKKAVRRTPQNTQTTYRLLRSKYTALVTRR